MRRRSIFSILPVQDWCQTRARGSVKADCSSNATCAKRHPDPHRSHGCFGADYQALLIVEYPQGLWGSRESPSSLCVAALKRGERDSLRNHVRSLGIHTVVIETQSDGQTVPAVRLATMHSAKDLEHERVIPASVNSDNAPPERLWDSNETGPERDAF